MSRNNFSPDSPVVMTPCETYDDATVKAALEASFKVSKPAG